jgi:isopentenyl diphosphate isomerase/L-lactate dehydrogenase-like FMN-dependent dehydrogenase
MIGRAWLYGLASGGEAGVEAALTMLRDEIDIAMALLGCSELSQIDDRVLARQ